jgi:predicted RNA-binding Zn ribbon-like protein
MTHEVFPWLGFPPAVDLANTVMVTSAGELDLLEDEGQLRAWIAAERGRIVGVEAACGRLTEVRALRDTIRGLLHARERRAPSGRGAAAGQRDLCLGAPQGRADARGPGRRGARRARYLRSVRVDRLALGS